MIPTIEIYGDTSRSNQELLKKISPDFAYKSRSAGAHTPVFSFTGEAYAADAMLFLPNCDLFSLCAALAENEVHNPFMQQTYDPTLKIPNNKKPIVCLGSKKDWKPFLDIIEGLKEAGTIREGLLEKNVHFTHSAKDAIGYIKSHLTNDLTNRRAEAVSHKTYIDSLDAADDLINTKEGTPKAKHSPTIAFFGSASSKNPKHKEIAEEAARMCGQNGWNIVHGGGAHSVMGALTDAGSAADAHVHGITATKTYAQILSGERDPDKILPDGMARFTFGKDMIHRIELYAKSSEALVALPGGIGTLEEIMMIMHLLHEKHPAVMYEDKSGKMVKKPMVLVNQNGIWDNLIAYYEHAGDDRITKPFKENIVVVNNIDELNATLKKHFEQHPPKAFAIDHLDDSIKSSERRKVNPGYRQGLLFPTDDGPSPVKR